MHEQINVICWKKRFIFIYNQNKYRRIRFIIFNRRHVVSHYNNGSTEHHVRIIVRCQFQCVTWLRQLSGYCWGWKYSSYLTINLLSIKTLQIRKYLYRSGIHLLMLIKLSNFNEQEPIATFVGLVMIYVILKTFSSSSAFHCFQHGISSVLLFKRI